MTKVVAEEGSTDDNILLILSYIFYERAKNTPTDTPTPNPCAEPISVCGNRCTEAIEITLETVGK